MHACEGRPPVIVWREEDDAVSRRAACQAGTRRNVRPRLHPLWRLRRGGRSWGCMSATYSGSVGW